MTGDSNVVEEAMQTLNDSGDLLRQVRGIHCAKCGLRRCELLSYRNGIKGMEWWNVWVRAAEALFATVSTRLRCSVRRRRWLCTCVCGCVILRLYADRVAEEGCRRGLRDVSELVWEDALVRTTLVTCRFCYSKPPLTLGGSSRVSVRWPDNAPQFTPRSFYTWPQRAPADTKEGSHSSLVTMGK